MDVTPTRVEEEHRRVRSRDDVVVPLINTVRDGLGSTFEVEVDSVGVSTYREAVDETFADGDRGVNVAALVGLLRNLDVAGDYPGFVVDEFLGRELAAMIAGEQPLRLIAESTFHYADVVTSHDRNHGGAGVDDLDAALAAGYQTVLPGWEWRETSSPFTIPTTRTEE